MVHHIPNILTVFRIAVTPIFVYTFFLPGVTWKIIALAIFIFSTITDKVDGVLARRYGWESALGKFLDPLADKVLITSAFICLIFYHYIEVWMVAIIVVRDLIVTWLRTFGHKRGRPVHTMEIARWKTAVQTVAVYIALVFLIIKAFSRRFALLSPAVQTVESWQLIWIVMLITTVFTLITGVIYLMENRHLFAKDLP